MKWIAPLALASFAILGSSAKPVCKDREHGGSKCSARPSKHINIGSNKEQKPISLHSPLSNRKKPEHEATTCTSKQVVPVVDGSNEEKRIACHPWGPGCKIYAFNYTKPAYEAAVHRICYSGDSFTASWNSRRSYDVTKRIMAFDTTTTVPETGLAQPCIEKPCKQGGNSKIAFAVVPSQDQKDCRPLKDHYLPTGEVCEQILDNVVDQCLQDTTDYSRRGGYFRTNTPDGCYDWWLWGVRLWGGDDAPELNERAREIWGKDI